jgi:pimeloyl-ACP methyl ester carboxylesterase
MFGEIKNSQGERIDYTFHDGGGAQKEIVVIGHGVTGNKDRPFVVALAEALAAAGVHAVRLSFSGNGDSDGRFVDSTISKEVADLGAVLDAMAGFTVCFAGHSMGGAVGVIRASEDDRIRNLISLAGMVHTRDFAEREFGDVKPDHGFMWDEETCPLSQTYMDDMRRIDSVADRGKRIRVPWLLVHGTDDDVVPIQDSKDILAKAGANAQFIEIPGSNHVFADEHCAAMISKVVAWVAKQFA